MAETKSISMLRLIFIPSVITLGITLLRLVGELQHWPTALFNPAAGGGGAIIGISWLPLIFGVYFALKLSEAGQGPENRGRAVRLSIVGMVLFIAGGFIAAAPQVNFPGKVIVGIVLAVLAIGLQYSGWPRLFYVLLAYGYAARIPVLIVMYIAMRGDWGTHYDVVPPGFSPETTFWPKFLQIAFLPQMFLWIAFTIITGMVTGSIAAAIKQRKNPTAQTAGA
ncbi:MAG TPA: hypothetical protein VJX74_04785 [Blastocatellia bacterium]|nr:hypothetical protein [Blastocatellia bacterium]